jgi:hypothetical protein
MYLVQLFLPLYDEQGSVFAVKPGCPCDGVPERSACKKC